MATFFQSNNCIKYGSYTLNSGDGSKEMPAYKPTGSVLKWYQTKMSYEEKYRFGLLTYQEYCMWQLELSNQSASGSNSSGDHFWDQDAAIRTNITTDEYDSFLAANNINVSNNATVDIDSIIQSVDVSSEAPASPAATEASEADINAVLRSVARDTHGETFLTQEEIDALFASAGN